MKKKISKITIIFVCLFVFNINLKAVSTSGELMVTVLSEDGKALKDAEFTIYQNKQEVGTMITDEMGEARSEILPGGTYTIRETTAPTGYSLNKTFYTATISVNGDIVDINNSSAVINYKINKDNYGQITGKVVDENNQAIEGAKFTIYDSNNDEIEQVSTNSKGIFISKELISNTYTIKQTAANDGYYIDYNTYEVEIVNDGEIIEINEDEPIINSQIETTDTGSICGRVSDENSNPMRGVEFTLYNDKNLEVAKTTTNDYGIFYFPRVLLGNYTLRETDQLPGFYVDKTVYSANLFTKDQELVVNSNNRIINYPIDDATDISTGELTYAENQYISCTNAFNGIVTNVNNNTVQTKQINVEEEEIIGTTVNRNIKQIIEDALNKFMEFFISQFE